jgi:hypothetical protein
LGNKIRGKLLLSSGKKKQERMKISSHPPGERFFGLQGCSLLPFQLPATQDTRKKIYESQNKKM